MKNVFLTILIAFALAGCGSMRTEPTVVKETKTVIVKIPAALLLPCDATAPMDRVAFIQLKSEDKEKELTALIVKLYADVKKCSDRIIGIKEFQDRIVKENEGKL